LETTATCSLANRSNECRLAPGTALNLLEVDEGAGRVWNQSSIIRLKIKYFQGQLASSRLYCDTLARQFAAAQTKTKTKKISCQHDEALKEVHALELLLALLQREERELGAEGGSGRAPSKSTRQNCTENQPP
jgi:hypothetical protein